jgi:hypothetical protein
MTEVTDEVVPGVYALICTATNEKYVGQAQNILKRCATHFRDLERQKHINPRLQHLYNEHGQVAFEVRLLAKLDDQQERLDVEKRYFDSGNFPLTSSLSTPKPVIEKAPKAPKKRKIAVYVTPWGKFETARKAEDASPAMTFRHHWIEKACRYPAAEITDEDFRTSTYFIGFFDISVVGKTFESFGFGAVYAETATRKS